MTYVNFNRALQYVYSQPGSPFMFIPGMVFDLSDNLPVVDLNVTQAQLPEVLRLLALS